jgi:protein phosphatase 1 regulatory subunit 7
MEIYSSKLNWLIHIKKLFARESVLDVSEFANCLKEETMTD